MAKFESRLIDSDIDDAVRLFKQRLLSVLSKAKDAEQFKQKVESLPNVLHCNVKKNPDGSFWFYLSGLKDVNGVNFEGTASTREKAAFKNFKITKSGSEGLLEHYSSGASAFARAVKRR